MEPQYVPIADGDRLVIYDDLIDGAIRIDKEEQRSSDHRWISVGNPCFWPEDLPALIAALQSFQEEISDGKADCKSV